MSYETPPGQDPEELQQLAMLVADNLAEGESPDEIAQQLVSSGWEEKDARGFISAIQRQMSAQTAPRRAHSKSGEGMSWLVWIGAIILFNVLSKVFGWGFTIF